MEKIWLKSYPPYVAPTLDIPATSLADLFNNACAQYQQQPAYTSFNTTLSYSQIATHSLQLAAYFQQHWQLKKGDRIAIMLPNILQFPIIFFAALQAGLTIVPINPLYTGRELILQLKDAQVQAVVVLAEMAYKLEEVLPEVSIRHVMVTNFTDLLHRLQAIKINLYLKYIKKSRPFAINQVTFFKEALQKSQGLTLKPVSLHGDDMALLQYTGGTTGLPRGVMLTHANMMANISQTRVWVEPVIGSASHKVALAPLPLYHIFSLMANNLLLMSLGYENILIADPRNINSLIKILRKKPLVLMTGVNTLYNALLQHPKFKHLDFSAQKVSLAGGMALQPSVALEWKKITGKFIIEAYGLTESSPAAIINPLDLPDYNGAMGLPLPATDIKICDDAGSEVVLGQVGELYIKGPQITQGYWHNPKETAQNITQDGFLKTGDLVKMDALGFIYFVDRKKDMLVVSGFNVYPTEVEAVICAHPGVREAAVVGESDPIHGSRIKCFIVKKDPNLTEKMLRDYLHHELTGYKRPQTIIFCDHLPKSAVGKILHRALR